MRDRQAVTVATIYVPHTARNMDVLDTFGRVDFDDLTGEVDRAGGEAVFWGIASADAKARSNQAAHDAKVVKVRVAQKVREEARTLGAKLTESDVAERVQLATEVLEVEQKMLDAERTAGLILSIIYAVSQKNRTLQELSGIVRDERAALRRFEVNPPLDEETRRRSREAAPSGKTRKKGKKKSTR